VSQRILFSLASLDHLLPRVRQESHSTGQCSASTAQILLGHGKAYQPLFRCTVSAAANPVQTREHSFDVFSYADESLYERLKASGYDPGPVLKKFTGISIAALEDLRHITRSIPRPKGNNTLRRWDEVFKIEQGARAIRNKVSSSVA
jgi:hypothetical protein